MANSYTPQKPVSSSSSCASCKHQRKGCRKNCIFRKHFPGDKIGEFELVQRVFGVSKIAKLITGCKDLREQEPRHSQEEQIEVVKSLCWEGKSWSDNPVLGPYGEYRAVRQELDYLKRALGLMQQQMPTNVNSSILDSTDFQGNVMNNLIRDSNDFQGNVTDGIEYTDSSRQVGSSGSQLAIMESLPMNNSYYRNSVQESSRQVGSQSKILQQHNGQMTVDNAGIRDGLFTNTSWWTEQQQRSLNRSAYHQPQLFAPNVAKSQVNTVVAKGNQNSGSNITNFR